MIRLADIKNSTRRILDYVLRLALRKGDPTETNYSTKASQPAEASESVATPIPASNDKTLGERPDHYYGQTDKGHWLHLQDILERISTCAAMVRELKRVNPDMYDFYRQFGAHVLPADTMFDFYGLSENFMQKWPSSGMMLQPSAVDHNGEKYLPHLLFFHKVNLKSVCKTEKVTLQPTTKCIYRISQVIKSPDIKYPLGGSFFVSVSNDGHAELLKQRVGKTPDFRRSRSSIQSATPGWDYPQELWLMYTVYCQNALEREEEPDTIEQWATELFCVAANAFSRATETAQVRIKASGTVVNVGVPLSRCPHFFRNRNIEAASDGRRKRIFHFVRGHERKLANGQTRTVRGHYRGERKFEWNGHPVTITVPDKHVTPDQWDVEMHEFKRPPKGGDWLTANEIGARVSDNFENLVRVQNGSKPRSAQPKSSKTEPARKAQENA